MGVLKDDPQLLRQFVEEHSETAFATLVQRHSALVYGTALRCLNGRTALAEDVAQQVFIDLARKAASLPQKKLVLGAWLHRHTRFLSATARRTEVRRLSREWTAHAMNEIPDNAAANAETLLEMLGPDLDEALDELADADREALVLRFLEKSDLRTVGQRMGLSDDAAQKRVSRALDRLRDLLARRGYTVPSAALGAILTRAALVDAPSALASTMTTVALAGTATLAGPTGPAVSTLQIASKGWMKIFGLIAAGVAIIALLTSRTPANHDKVVHGSRRSSDTGGAGSDLSNSGSGRLKESGNITRWRREREALLRQRGSISELSPASPSTNAPPDEKRFKVKLAFEAFSEGLILTANHWDSGPGRYGFALLIPKIQSDGTILIETKVMSVPAESVLKAGPGIFTELMPEFSAKTNIMNGLQVYTASNARLLSKFLEQMDGVSFIPGPRIQTSGGVASEVRSGTDFVMGLTATIQPDGNTLSLDLNLDIDTSAHQLQK